MEPEIFDYMEDQGSHGLLPAYLPQLIRDGKAIYGYPSQGYWNDVGRPETYLKATSDLLNSGSWGIQGERIKRG